MLNTPDFTNDYDQAEVQQNKVMAFLGYIPPLFFLPLCCTQGSKYARFHANQGLVLLIVYAAVSVVVGIMSAIFTAIGVGFVGTLFGALEIVPVLLSVFGIVNTCKGKTRELPVIGGIRILK